MAKADSVPSSSRQLITGVSDQLVPLQREEQLR
jgi:hypothetical protein